MKRKAKALVSEYKNELPPARTLYVSLDRADNVIEGGRALHPGKRPLLGSGGAALPRIRGRRPQARVRGNTLDPTAPAPGSAYDDSVRAHARTFHSAVPAHSYSHW